MCTVALSNLILLSSVCRCEKRKRIAYDTYRTGIFRIRRPNASSGIRYVFHRGRAHKARKLHPNTNVPLVKLRLRTVQSVTGRLFPTQNVPLRNCSFKIREEGGY